MDFFEHQVRAKRSSALLVILMVLAVLSLISISTLAIGFVLRPEEYRGAYPWLPSWPIIAAVSVSIIAVVGLGSWLKWCDLRRGGAAIAQSLGGRLINTDPQDLAEQRVLNVVEEMALASGMPVPEVYVLDESGINAFAAGLTPQDAVIGVTRGALNALNRDELQGVIAHEFSHILHGDMRLNTHLVAVLNGILFMGLLGSLILRNLPRGRSSKNDSTTGLVAAIAMIGLVLWVLGYSGTFFGQLIRSAVSRQREYLADASAVQYTRYAHGIAGALQKIASSQSGSALDVGRAGEFSHLFFAKGVSGWLSGFFATHPPLRKRIRRILPNWDGSLTPAKARPEPVVAKSGATASMTGVALGVAISAAGAPAPAHLAQARSSLAQLPSQLKQAAHSSQGAQCLLYALLLDSQAEAAAQQLRALQPRLDEPRYRQLLALREAVQQLPALLRLPLLDLLLPSLKQTSRDQRQQLLGNLGLLIRSDARVSLYEWTLLRIVERHLKALPSTYGRKQLGELTAPSALLLSLLARLDSEDEVAAQAAFDRGARSLGLPEVFLRDAQACTLKALETALKELNQLNPLDKPQLFKAMASVIEHDGQVSAREAELLRALADILDCPLPPLLNSAA